MNNLDKIYLPAEELEERSEWLGEKTNEQDILYIRKDALVEWAEERLDETRRETYISQYPSIENILVYEKILAKVKNL